MNTPLVTIETDVNPDFLCYDWKISRKSRVLTKPVTENHHYKEHVLLSVTKQPLTVGKTTQSHGLSSIADDTPTTLYISEIKVYFVKQTNLSNVATFSGIYTLEEIQQGKIHTDDAVPALKTTSGTTSKTPNHTVNCQISREKRAFFCTSKLTEEAYYQGECSEDDPFAKERIKEEIEKRLNHVGVADYPFPYPNQGPASLCGPAAFFYCLLRDRPDIYEKAAWALWKYGKVKIGKLNIKPSNACRHVDHLKTPYNSISGLDWLTLASLRDSENNIGKYDEIEDRVAGISFPSDLISWFNKVGCKNVIDNTSLYVSRNVNELVELNSYYSDNYSVILFVSANVINGEEGSNNKDHWICLASNVKVSNENVATNSSLNDTIRFDFFTWGSIRTFNYFPTLNTFIKRFYGGLAFTPIR